MQSEDNDDLPAVGKVWEGAGESLSSLMAKHAASVKADVAVAVLSDVTVLSNVEAVRPGDLSDQWKAMISLLAQQGPALPGLLQHGQFIGVEDGRAVIRYAPQHETFVKLLERNGKKDLVRDALSKVMDQPVGIRFEISDATVQPPPPPPDG